MTESLQLAKDIGPIQALAPGGRRIALELSSADPHWPDMWSESVAMAALLQRRGSHAICVDRNWSISFTQAYRCGPGDAIAAKVELAPADEKRPVAPLFNLGRYSAYTVTP